MTNAWLADFDAIAHTAFADAGLADTAVLRAPGGAVHGDVRCMVSRGVQVLADEGSVTSNQTTVDLLKADLPASITKAWVVVLSDGEYLIDSQPLSSDESLVRYLLRRKQ